MRQLFPLIMATAGAGLAGVSAQPVPVAPLTSEQPAPAGTGWAALAARARPGAFAAAALDPATGELLAAVDADRPMPMLGVGKAPLAAAVLTRVDAGRLSLDQKVAVGRADLSAPESPINEAWPGRTTYTVAELIEAAAGESDNTAADVLMRLIGGPRAVTTFVREAGIRGMRFDRYGRELHAQSLGLGRFRPEWAREASFAAALTAVPEERRLAAARAYLADPRDTATAYAAALFMAKLARGELLSAASTARLLEILARTGAGEGRLKAGLPTGAVLAHKTGTGRSVAGIDLATNDVGLVTLADGRQVAIASFLAGSTASAAEREAVHAETARLATADPGAS